MVILQSLLALAVVSGDEAAVVESERAVGLPVLATVSEIDRYWGPATTTAFLLEDPDRETPSVGICWLKVAYTDYDIASHPEFATRCNMAGVVHWPGHIVPVLGACDAHGITLVDAEFLVGEATASGAELAASVKALDSRSWIASSFEFVAPDGQSVRMTLSAAHAADLDPKAIAASQPRPIETSKSAEQVWIGGYLANDARLHLRVETLTVRTGDSSEVVVGMSSLRFADRRFEGAMPPGSPWPDRRSLGRALAKIAECGTEYWSGAFDDRTAQILKSSAGRVVTKEEFHSILQQAFGELANSVDASCMLPEVQHVPLIRAGDAKRLVGASWDRPDPSKLTFNRQRVYELPMLPANNASIVRVANTRLEG